MQDWQDYVEFFATVLPEWKGKALSFTGVTTLDGVSVDGVWNQGRFTITLHPNGAREVRVKVSQGEGMIQVAGQANGPGSFSPHQITTLTFKDNQPIVLSN